MSGEFGVRSFLQSPHHFCSRCGREFLLSDLTWQEGHLRCPDDVDTMLIGDRETAINQVLRTDTKELMPDDKLTVEGGIDLDTITFTI